MRDLKPGDVVHVQGIVCEIAEIAWQMLNERWILLDAMDSGFSIDNVIEMKDLFQLVLNDAKQIQYGN